MLFTDDFDTARPGTDLSVPLKNIVNEYYSKDLSKKVETGKHSIWAQGGFSEGTPPYGYYRATDGSRKLLIDEEVSDNVVRIFNIFLDGKGYAGYCKDFAKRRKFFHLRNTDSISQERLNLLKKQENGTIRM